jgi:hypothetical protein
LTKPGLLVLPACALFALAGSAGANSHPTALSVAVWPARVTVMAPGTTTVRVGNPGGASIRLVVRARGYALDPIGRPLVLAPTAKWLSGSPTRLVVPAHGVGGLHVRVRRPAGARPGDHAQLLVLSTEPAAGRRVVASLRIGIVVVPRIPGRLVHRLEVRRIHARTLGPETVVAVTVANRGNLDEWLGRGRLSVTLARRGAKPLTAPTRARRLLARSIGIAAVRFRLRVHGRVTLVVVVRRPAEGVRLLRRRYRLRL